MHLKLLNLLDLSRLTDASESALQEDLRRGVEMILAEEKIPLPAPEKERLCREIRNELLGYGPLEPLLADSSINDILVNSYGKVFIERRGKLEPSLIRFTDNAHLLKIIEKIASGVGRRIDESCPMVDARLPDGSRVNAIIPPLALDGPALSIRKFARDPINVEGLDRIRRHYRRYGRGPAGYGPGPSQHPDLRRHRHRQNHVSQCVVQFHPL